METFNTIIHLPTSSSGATSSANLISSTANPNTNTILYNDVTHTPVINSPFSHQVADINHVSSSTNSNWLDEESQQEDHSNNNELENDEVDQEIARLRSVGQNQNQKKKAVRKKKRSFIWHLVQVFPDPETAEAFIRQDKTLAVHRKNLDAAVRRQFRPYTSTSYLLL